MVPSETLYRLVKTKSFAQVFVKGVQGLELRRKRGQILARGRAQKHLVAAAHQQSDFVGHQHAGFSELDFTLAGIIDDGSIAAANDFGSLGRFALALETGLLELGEMVFKSQLGRGFAAKEHKSLL